MQDRHIFLTAAEQAYKEKRPFDYWTNWIIATILLYMNEATAEKHSNAITDFLRFSWQSDFLVGGRDKKPENYDKIVEEFTKLQPKIHKLLIPIIDKKVTTNFKKLKKDLKSLIKANWPNSAYLDPQLNLN
jgi:hypothetical protein